ncbi:unnamed protein product, partial [Polarella glacialis]
DDVVLEVSWCRQLVGRAEKEYSAMVDGLLEENEQLEGLLGLLTRQLDNLADGFPAQELESPAAAQAAARAGAQVSLHLDELLLQRGEELRRARAEQVLLQHELREEVLESRNCQRRYECSLEELAAAPAAEYSDDFDADQ